MTDQKNTLVGFYRARFNADPYSLLAHFSSDIADAADQVGIRWDSISSRIQLLYKSSNGDEKLKGHIGTTEPRYKGRVAVYPTQRVEKDRHSGESFYIPNITFTTYADGRQSSVWDGLGPLLELYQRERHLAVSEQQQQWRDEQERKRKAREARAAAEEEKQKIRRARLQAEHNAYEAAFLRGGRHTFGNRPGDFVELIGDEDGSAPYLVRKKVRDVARICSLKRMRDSKGEFTAIALHDIAGEFRGLQRLYESAKCYTRAVQDHQFNGAHCLIGNVEAANVAYVAEGFATAASAHLANELPVIVAMNADNLVKVVAAYRKSRPDLELIILVDNDSWKSKAGNKGMLTALELVKQYGVKAVFPTFKHWEDAAEAQPTDFNDLHVRDGLPEVKRQLRARDNVLRAEKQFFNYVLQRLQFVGTQRKAATDAALQAAGIGMMLSPIVYSSKEVQTLIAKSLPADADLDIEQLESRIKWLGKGKMKASQNARSFTKRKLDQAHINYIRLKGIRMDDGSTLIPDNLVDVVAGLAGCVIVRAPMGSGKTERLIKPIMQRSHKAAYIAHRISLIGDASTRLSDDHLTCWNYQDVIAVDMPYVSHLATCVNSIVNPKFKNHDDLSWFETVETLCIDEASQVLRHTANGPVDNPVRVFDAMVAAMRAPSVRQVLLCDADANDMVIDLCEMARPGEQIHVIEVTGSCDHIEVLHTDIDSAFQLAIEAAKKGERVLVADDSAKDGKKLAAVLAAEIPGLKVLHVHKDSKADAQVEAFLSDPDAQCVNYDVVIYSPAISSGVSIKRKHFSAHVGIFHNVVIPSDAIQMMRRDRKARRYIVGIGINNTQRETDREAIFRGLLAADDFSVEFYETAEEITLRRRKSIFDEIRLAAIANENKARNDFANNLLLILHSDGYRVSRLESDESRVEAAKAAKEFGGVIVAEQRFDLVMSVETPDDDQYQKLTRSEVKSVEEAAKCDRYVMEKQLCVDEIDREVIEFYDDRGLKQVVTMELLQSTDDQASAYDRVQIRNKVVITRHNYKRAHRHILVSLFEGLGVDRKTGAGEFTATDCRRVMDGILTDQAAIEMYNALKVGAHVNPKALPKDVTTFVKNILARLGLTVHKRKSNGKNLLSISPDSWARVSYYVERRAARGVSSLSITESETSTHRALIAGEEPAQAAKDAAPVVQSVNRDTLHDEIYSLNVKYPCVALNALLSQFDIDPESGVLSADDFEDYAAGRLSLDDIRRHLQLMKGAA